MPLPFASFKPSSKLGPGVLEADVSDLNLTTITPRGASGGASTSDFTTTVLNQPSPNTATWCHELLLERGITPHGGRVFRTVVVI